MERLYRLLLALLPSGYDRRDRAEMLDTFETRVRAGRGGRERLATQVSELVDLSWTVLASRLPRGLPDSFVRDLRQGLRALSRSPLTTALAVASLALGLGATSAIYSCLDVWLIRPLPLPEADRLLSVAMANRERGWRANVFSPLDFLEWREQAHTVELAGYRATSSSVAAEGAAQRVSTLQASADLLHVLGLQPQAGRGFSREDELPGSRVALLSEGFALRARGSVAAAIGSSVLLDGERHLVVGVLPRMQVIPPLRSEVWVPLVLPPDSPRAGHSIEAVARLAEGVSLAAARDELGAVAADVASRDPQRTFPEARVVSLRDGIYGEVFEQAGTVLGAAVLLVLLIACANIANLLLARGAARAREIGVRAALGAGRGRIVRQLFTESLLLAGMGGLAGLGVARLGVQLLVTQVLPADVPGADQIALDGRVVGMAAAFTLLSAFVFGLLPAVRASRSDLRAPLASSGLSERRGGSLTARSLVVAEIALSLSLLAASGLLIGSLLRMRSVDMGIRVDDSVTFSLYVPPAVAADGDAVASFQDRVREEIGALPGVVAVAASSGPPIGGWSTLLYAEAGDQDPDRRRSAEYRVASDDYQRVLRMEMVSGRWFSERTDTPGGAPAVAVSRTLAEGRWGSADAAIGKQIALDDETFTVVGVVESGRVRGPQQRPPEMIFRPLSQSPSRNLFYVVDARSATDQLLAAVRDRVAAIDPGVAVARPATLRQLFRERLSAEAASLEILATLAGMALVLTMVGVYGVVAHTVRRRGREMGLRMALGASSRDVLRLVLRQGLGLAAVGVAFGLVIALLLGRGLTLFLAGVRAADPAALGLAVVSMFLVVAGACYLPARRAARVDPAASLRAE